MITRPAQEPDYSRTSDCRAATSYEKRTKTPLDGPFTHEASASHEWPNRMVGKILFRRPNGEYASCSGALLQKRLVVTAGHCAYKNGQYMSKYAFIPGFEYAIHGVDCIECLQRLLEFIVEIGFVGL